MIKRESRNLKGSEGPNHIIHISSKEATLLKKPYINGYFAGHGTHGDRKYNRLKTKEDLKRMLSE